MLVRNLTYDSVKIICYPIEMISNVYRRGLHGAVAYGKARPVKGSKLNAGYLCAVEGDLLEEDEE